MNSLKYIYENDLGFTCFDRYFEYLKGIEIDMPESMKKFVLDPERYELNGRRTLHDAWLRTLCLTQDIANQWVTKSVRLDFELATGQRCLTLNYRNVAEIKTQLNPGRWPERPVDLLVHEVSKDGPELFRHILVFDRGIQIEVSFASLEIEEKDL